jgi:outer membrane protein assembly factor BamB
MRSAYRKLIAAVAPCILLSGICASAADWPQWRGPNRDGISKETGLLKEWPEGGPKLLWQIKNLGSGYSTPSVVGRRMYLLANKGLEDEFVKALDIKDGSEIWSVRVGKVGEQENQAKYPGARSTPTLEGDVLYALGSDGDLVCLETAAGKLRWKKSLPKDFGGEQGAWAYSESPLIDGDALVCTPGGKEATMIALNKKSGDVIWKCALPEGDDAAYSSAVVVEAGGVRQYVQLLQKGLVGVDAKTGKLLWRFAKPISRFDANIPTPVAADGYVYTASAGTGGGAVKLTSKGGEVEAEQVYFDAKNPTAIGGAVKIGSFLFSTTGQAMVCLDFVTGEMKWQNRGIGPASLCYADARLYLHGENGEVALVEPSPDEYRERGRFTPPDQPDRGNSKAWAYPVVANGRLYIRDLDCLWCYDIKDFAVRK